MFSRTKLPRPKNDLFPYHPVGRFSLGQVVEHVVDVVDDHIRNDALAEADEAEIEGEVSALVVRDHLLARQVGFQEHDPVDKINSNFSNKVSLATTLTFYCCCHLPKHDRQL